jgi:hypothetical protein
MLHGQLTIAATGVAEPLGTGIANKPIMIKAMSTNSAIAYVGDSTLTTANGFELVKTEEIRLKWLGDISKIYVIGTQNDKLCYITLEE